jgi:hypothetical protein
MEPTSYEIDIALAEAWAASTPGLRIRYLARKQGWVLEALEKPATLVETAGLLNPPPELFPVLLSELQSFASTNGNFEMFSIPDCARMIQEGWNAEPFRWMGEYANCHCLIHDVRRQFALPRRGHHKTSPVMVRRAYNHSRLETLVKKLAAQFYPEEPRHTLALALLQGMADNLKADFLEISLCENELMIGGLVLLHYGIFCYPAYAFIEKGHRVTGLLPVLAFFQEVASREGIQYIIGDIPHYTLRPRLRRVYEKIGARVKYTRCHYSMDHVRS